MTKNEKNSKSKAELWLEKYGWRKCEIKSLILSFLAKILFNSKNNFDLSDFEFCYNYGLKRKGIGEK
jgi:hypothetical protein